MYYITKGEGFNNYLYSQNSSDGDIFEANVSSVFDLISSFPTLLIKQGYSIDEGYSLQGT